MEFLYVLGMAFMAFVTLIVLTAVGLLFTNKWKMIDGFFGLCFWLIILSTIGCEIGLAFGWIKSQEKPNILRQRFFIEQPQEIPQEPPPVKKPVPPSELWKWLQKPIGTENVSSVVPVKEQND